MAVSTCVCALSCCIAHLFDLNIPNNDYGDILIMSGFLKNLWNYISVRSDPVEAYLAEATDICDLERRMGEVERGRAPFQRNVYLSTMYR